MAGGKRSTDRVRVVGMAVVIVPGEGCRQAVSLDVVPWRPRKWRHSSRRGRPMQCACLAEAGLLLGKDTLTSIGDRASDISP